MTPMPRSTWFRVNAYSLAAAALLLCTPLAPAQATTTIDIQADKSLHKVSPTLYGLMTEEINYSYDGGLYAEMVRNRTFDHEWSGFVHWDTVETGTGRATMSDEPTSGPTLDLPHSLRLNVTAADAQNPAGLRNDGYWGMALRPDTTYTGSFFAKLAAPAATGMKHAVPQADATSVNTPYVGPATGQTLTPVGPVTVSLVSDMTGHAVATATTAPLTGTWQKYEFTLHTGKIVPSSANHLELTLAQPGAIDVQLVSLFPPTYKNRANGNRIDLMEMLAGLHPKFLRMPGGNYLEGDTVEERFNWKTTLGKLEDRPTHRSPWNYQSTDGLGLLEFLEWTEDLKIDPVLAVYAGYSLKGTHIAGGATLKPFIDDALDEIEFTIGDSSTKWGAIRTQLGHPAPFPLHYVEIGNEDEFDRSGSYGQRYAQFYKAIKAAYPQLELIATTPIQTMKPDVIDDHYYRKQGEFYNMLQMYDKADRSGPKVFVGEWATREGSPTTNLGAMLGDAAFMTSLERNSDLIVMASYAPLLVNVNPGGMQWESDLIGYDAMSSYGSPSYYAQGLFAQSLGTDVPESTKTGGSERLVYSVTSDASHLYLKLVNATSTAQPIALHLNGAGKIAKDAAVDTIGGTNPSQTNSITDPRHIVPVHSVLHGAGAAMQHTVPAYSVQVITFSTNK